MEKENYYAEAKNLPLGVKVLRFYFKYLGRFFPRMSGMIFWTVFCIPKRRKIRDKHEKFLKTAKVKTIAFEDKKIAAYHWGRGDKKVLIVHGWEGMTADFDEIITKLTITGYQVLAFDLPGHGKSSGKRTHIPMIMRLLEKLITDYGPFYGIVSHSLGAAASAFTLAHLNGTSKLSKMVLLGLHPLPFIFFEQFRLALRINDAMFEKCLVYVERKIKLKVKDFSVPSVKSMISADKILLVHDEKDQVVNIRNIKNLNDEWDQSELFFGDHGGHFKHYKHKDVVDKVVEFMAM